MPVKLLPVMTRKARAGLTRALGADIDVIAGEVDKGHSQLFYFAELGSYMVTRHEIPDGDPDSAGELVVVAYEGRDVANCVNFAHSVARANRVPSIRAHCRPAGGMGRYLKRFGFVEVERVYRAEVCFQPV